MRDKMILVNETRSTLNFTSLKAGEVVDYLCYVSNGFNNGTDNLTITVGGMQRMLLCGISVGRSGYVIWYTV